MTYAELNNALTILGLPGRATLAEIKKRHRQLVKTYHPDNGGEHDPERIRQINAAYSTIRNYLENYQFSFAEEEFYEQNPEELLRRQFMTDPLWGGTVK